MPEPFIERFFRVDHQVSTHILSLRTADSLFYKMEFFGRKLHGPVPIHVGTTCLADKKHKKPYKIASNLHILFKFLSDAVEVNDNGFQTIENDE